MLTWAIVLFLVGAVLGLIVLTNLLKGKPSPKPAVFAHGLFVAIALIIVILAVTGASGDGPKTAMIVLIVAALGGITLFAMDMGKKTMPRALLILHPIIAVIGVILLLVYVFGAGRTM